MVRETPHTTLYHTWEASASTPTHNDSEAKVKFDKFKVGSQIHYEPIYVNSEEALKMGQGKVLKVGDYYPTCDDQDSWYWLGVVDLSDHDAQLLREHGLIEWECTKHLGRKAHMGTSIPIGKGNYKDVFMCGECIKEYNRTHPK